MTKEEIDSKKYVMCCPLCDHVKCVSGTDKCEAEIWAKQKMAESGGEGVTDETTKPSWDEYQDISNTLTQLLKKGYTKPMIKTVLEQLILEQQPRWIPVSERLPKYGEHIIITLKGIFREHPIITDVSYFDGDFRIENGDGCFSDVIAWMPLPEPYEAESDAQKMSSVTPQRPEGRWIATENEEMNIDGYFCSCCDLPMETEERTKYCPNCGAKMKAESEEK